MNCEPGHIASSFGEYFEIASERLIKIRRLCRDPGNLLGVSDKKLKRGEGKVFCFPSWVLKRDSHW